MLQTLKFITACLQKIYTSCRTAVLIENAHLQTFKNIKSEHLCRGYYKQSCLLVDFFRVFLKWQYMCEFS